MEGKDKRDVDAEVVLQVSQENSQPTESDIDQAIVVSTVSTSVPFPTNNPTYCSYDYVQNIRCENKLPEHMHKDSAEGDRLMIKLSLVYKVSSVTNKYKNSTSNGLFCHW